MTMSQAVWLTVFWIALLLDRGVTQLAVTKWGAAKIEGNPIPRFVQIHFGQIGMWIVRTILGIALTLAVINNWLSLLALKVITDIVLLVVAWNLVNLAAYIYLKRNPEKDLN